MPRRLARKLMLAITVIVFLVAAISAVVNVKSEERQFLNAVTMGAGQLSRGLTSATWQFMLDDHREAAYRVMQTIAAKQGVDYIRMVNRAGQVVYSTNPSASDQSPVALDSEVRIYTHSDGHRRLAMVTPIFNEPSCSQAACHAHPKTMKVLGAVDMALSLRAVDTEIAAFKWRVVVRAGIEVALIGLFVVFFTRRFVSQPIGKLIEGTEAVSQMELDRPIDIVHSSEELDKLTHSFDLMRERLRAAVSENNQFTQKLETMVEERTRQLKQAHQKLLQTDRLASLGQLSASVAHEINNPVSGVLNLGMLMQRMLQRDGIPPSRLEEFRKYLNQVVSETTRVGRIVTDLLSFSRRSKPHRAPDDLNHIVRTTLSVVQHKLKLSNVEIETHLTEDLPPVSCDHSQIQQVVLNLMLNAAEATQPKGGGRVVVSTRSGSDEVILQVSDNGEGIQPENLAKIFDPFFTTKPEGKGVGLGLAVSYGIIQAHGGDIEVKSKVGEGATFVISLPLQQTIPPAEPSLLELARQG